MPRQVPLQARSRKMQIRELVVVLGDQLDPDSPVFAEFDAQQDAVWMCEAPAEARYAWSHKARIAVFLSAMRHYAHEIERRGWRLIYRATAQHEHDTLAEALAADLGELQPQRIRLLWPGEHRLVGDLEAVAKQARVELAMLEDPHFLCSRQDFADWMQGRRQPRMENFYRWMRQRTGWLMHDGEPEGGRWNFDEDNRKSFGAHGPGDVPPARRFEPDAITRQVLALVAERYADHPGELDGFDWPLTRGEALHALADFIEQRLAGFGHWQDAMWTDQPLLHHSRLSAAMNLKLLDPREVCAAAIEAYRQKRAPLAAVEGFVRQILGWREYVRGLYWQRMPEFADDNELGADQPLPWLYWNAQTHMQCMAQTVGQTLKLGYAHHIQRLMVTGLFALLLGVRPREIHLWYLAVYVDAVEWVELPNTIGMSQFADGGILGSKPYVASGRYIERMSNYCAHCRYDPGQAVGDEACPFTTLYWDFLDRHERRFDGHPRLQFQVKNLQRKSKEEREQITQRATWLRARLAEQRS
jgi:deoxyribodipyrimidine photolyase-related protein